MNLGVESCMLQKCNSDHTLKITVLCFLNFTILGPFRNRHVLVRGKKVFRGVEWGESVWRSCAWKQLIFNHYRQPYHEHSLISIAH